MKIKDFIPFLGAMLLAINSFAQDKHKLWTMEIYRTGKILKAERTEDGIPSRTFSKEKVNNIIFNSYLEVDGVYSRVDLTLITFTLFNQDQNQHWSMNITLGAFLNDEAIEFGNVRNYFGVGADFDLTFSSVYGTGTNETDFDNGTIGLNIRWDLEIGEWLLVQNNITRGWWGSPYARKWDFKTVIALETIEGLYLTAAPNLLINSKEKTYSGKVIKEQTTQFYWTFGLGFEIF